MELNTTTEVTTRSYDPDDSSPDCAEGIHIPTGFSPNNIGPEENNAYSIIIEQDVVAFNLK